LWNIKECCELARELAPAMLILEDVDLIATRRDQNFQTTALHQLMNEMDGLDSDVEVVFLLTTNQPDQIEPALSNRPGRIDQTIHFPLPDETCRRRLIELYRGRSTLAINDWTNIIEKTTGSSPAFIKELIRKAAIIAVEETTNGNLTLTDEHLSEAFHEMTSGDGKLTRRITGFSPGADASATS
jgi:ATP-dependent 26S proteasome regulatory subunit